MPEQSINSTDPQQDYLRQLQQEAQLLSPEERAEHEQLVTGLAGELALSQALGQLAESALADARYKPYEKKEPTPEATVTVDLSKVGWIRGEKSLDLPLARIENEAGPYYLASLIEQNRTTARGLRNLAKSGQAEKLMEKLTAQALPRLWRDILSGQSNHRPERDINTSYPVYKVPVQGTNNRAIVLQAGRGAEGLPVFVVCALYDHDDQGKIVKQLYLHDKHKK